MLYENQYIITYLATVGGINASQTTGIKLQSVAGIDTTKPSIILIDYADPLDETKAEWVTYTSIDVNQELVGAVRGAEKGSGVIHSQNAVIALPHSESHINQFADIFHPTATSSNAEQLLLKETASPPTTPDSGYKKIYADTDGHQYVLDSTGAVSALINQDMMFNGMARQAAINGNFDVWQRGTTSATLVDGTSTFLADRWKDVIADDGGTLPTITRTRQLLTSGDIPNAHYYSRLTVNGAGTSLGASSYHFYRESIENGVRNLCGLGKKVTVSFWARSDIANKRICPVLIQNYGSGGSPSTQEPILGTPITLTSTWTKYTATFTTNTLAGKTFGTANDDSIRMDFYSMWGTTWGNTYVQASVTAETYVGSGNIDIAQVQLCAGDVALPFMPKSYEEELRACQRFTIVYQSTDILDPIAAGYCNSTTRGFFPIQLPVEMRIIPTLTATAGDWVIQIAGANIDVTAISIPYTTTKTITVLADVASGLTAGQGAILSGDATAGRLLILTSEL